MRQGSLIVVAFPDFLIYYPDTWHKPVSQRLGLMSDAGVKAGHACVLALDYVSGDVGYYDFGRYCTPDGYGRARTVMTDPEISIDIKATYQHGCVRNLDLIMQWFYAAEDIHHGAGPMYFTEIPDVDINQVAAFAECYTDKGYIPYEIFGKSTTNCSRYVREMLLNVVSHHRLNAYYKHYCPSATPMDNVASFASETIAYSYDGNGFNQHTLTWQKAIQYYFRKRKGYTNDTTRVPIPHLHWVASRAIGNYFNLKQEYTQLWLEKYDPKGNLLWEQPCTTSASIDLSQAYHLDLGDNPNQLRLTQGSRVVLVEV